MTNQSAEIAAAEAQGELVGYFVGALLFAFLLSRLGLYLRRSSRHEMSTVAGVHLICFFFLAIVSCSGTGRGPPGLTILFAQLSIFLIDYFRLPDPEAYRDDEPQRASAIKPLGYVAIGAALLLGLAATIIAKKPVTDETIAADIERGMASTEGGRLYLESIKRNFPDDHRALVASLVQLVRQSEAKGDTPEVRQQLQQRAMARAEELLARHRPAVVRAPPLPLSALARASRDFVAQAEREAPEICAAYALGAPTLEQVRTMPDSLRLPATRMTVAMLDAARAGLDTPVQRDFTRPPQAMPRLLAKVKAQLPPALNAIVGDANAMAARPVADRCRIAVAYYSGMASLPPEDSANLTAYNYSPDS